MAGYDKVSGPFVLPLFWLLSMQVDLFTGFNPNNPINLLPSVQIRRSDYCLCAENDCPTIVGVPTTVPSISSPLPNGKQIFKRGAIGMRELSYEQDSWGIDEMEVKNAILNDKGLIKAGEIHENKH